MERSKRTVRGSVVNAVIGLTEVTVGIVVTGIVVIVGIVVVMVDQIVETVVRNVLIMIRT